MYCMELVEVHSSCPGHHGYQKIIISIQSSRVNVKWNMLFLDYLKSFVGFVYLIDYYEMKWVWIEWIKTPWLNVEEII